MAMKLTLAAHMGTLTLTLRNDADTEIVTTVPVTGRDIRFLQEALIAKLGNGKEDDVNSESGPQQLQPALLVSAESPKQESAQIKMYRGSVNTLVHINRR